jgi:hypothetical protein
MELNETWRVARALRDFELVGAPSFGVRRAGLLAGCPAQFHRGAQGKPRVVVLHDELADRLTFPFDTHMHSDRHVLKPET